MDLTRHLKAYYFQLFHDIKVDILQRNAPLKTQAHKISVFAILSSIWSDLSRYKSKSKDCEGKERHPKKYLENSYFLIPTPLLCLLPEATPNNRQF